MHSIFRLLLLSSLIHDQNSPSEKKKKSLPQCPHVTIVTLIVVVGAAFCGSLSSASQTHFTQIPPRAGQTALPKHLIVH